MPIENKLIIQWISTVSQIKGLLMDPATLADDVVLMAYVFNDPATFHPAMQNVVRALSQLVTGVVDTSQLERSHSGWDSYHFQSQRIQNQRADLRIVFRMVTTGSIRVKGFGHRHLPLDIYKRLKPR